MCVCGCVCLGLRLGDTVDFTVYAGVGGRGVGRWARQDVVVVVVLVMVEVVAMVEVDVVLVVVVMMLVVGRTLVPLVLVLVIVVVLVLVLAEEISVDVMIAGLVIGGS
jgi:hypothetical protein